MSRQRTPDIMGNLMNGNVAVMDSEQENGKAIKQANSIDLEQVNGSLENEHESNKTIILPKNKAIKQDSDKEIIDMKEKATFNLSLSALESLEDAWIKLKRQFKGEQRITKTAIVEMALGIAVEDLKERGSESLLYKRLVDSKKQHKD